MPLIGAHVSIAGGVKNAPERAYRQGSRVMQIFVQAPQAYKTPKTTDDEIRNFGIELKKNKIKNVYVHAPYLVSLASVNNRTRYGSASLIRRNLERASQLGCCAMMTHLGSYGDQDPKKGIDKVVKSLESTLKGYTGSCELLLELSAGSGKIIGSTFEEIKVILKGLRKYKVGVCLDTAHIFASGYDLCGKKAIDATIKEFDKVIGLKFLKVIHCNDSKVPKGSKKDRHEDIGDGEIGKENLKAFIHHPKLKNIDVILETPGDEKRRKRDIESLMY